MLGASYRRSVRTLRTKDRAVCITGTVATDDRGTSMCGKFGQVALCVGQSKVLVADAHQSLKGWGWRVEFIRCRSSGCSCDKDVCAVGFVKVPNLLKFLGVPRFEPIVITAVAPGKAHLRLYKRAPHGDSYATPHTVEIDVKR